MYLYTRIHINGPVIIIIVVYIFRENYRNERQNTVFEYLGNQSGKLAESNFYFSINGRNLCLLNGETSLLLIVRNVYLNRLY